MWKSSLLLCLILQTGETSVQELLARIEALEKRVQELEADRRPPVPPAPAPPAPASLNAGSHNGSDPQQAALPAAAALPQYPSLELRGFSDIDFSGSDQKGTHSGFSEGQFTLHLVSALAPKVNFFSEITLSARRDAGLGGAPGFNPEVERAIVRFDQSDAFKVSFGRYHTPINWWNCISGSYRLIAGTELQRMDYVRTSCVDPRDAGSHSGNRQCHTPGSCGSPAGIP